MTATRLTSLTLLVLAVAAGALLAPSIAQGGGGGCREPATDARGTTVDLKESCMVPKVLRVAAGAPVTWRNRDATQHTVTGELAGPASWGSDVLAQDQTYVHVFAREGVYPYFCFLHAGMVGAVVVGDGSAAAFPAEMGGALPDAGGHGSAAAGRSDSSMLGVAKVALPLGLLSAVASGAATLALVRARASRRATSPH